VLLALAPEGIFQKRRKRNEIRKREHEIEADGVERDGKFPMKAKVMGSETVRRNGSKDEIEA